ncbi:MAG: hypothetical protein KQJ78_07140 [Deltaproteobacteria bacterium]|nr:hypothetical protein [Deltaproteobacteria bacterium]
MLSLWVFCLPGPGWALGQADPFLAGQTQTLGLDAASLSYFNSHDVAQDQTENLVLTQWTEFVDSDGNWGARGQVVNQGTERIWFGKVKIDLFDKETGAFVANEFGYINGETARTQYGITTDTTLAPGDTATFDIEFTDWKVDTVQAGAKSFAWSTYDAEPLLTQVELTEMNEYTFKWKYLKRPAEWAGRGLVRNTGSEWSFFNKVHVDFFNEAGDYIGDDFTYVDGQMGTISGIETDTALAPGATGSFDLKYTGVPRAQVASIRTRVWWDEN